MKIVFIGDDTQPCNLATAALGRRWPDVVLLKAATAAEGLSLIGQETPTLVLLSPSFTDMTLPKFLTEVRRFSHVPILVLGRYGDESELVTALHMGADDYVPLHDDPTDVTDVMVRVWSLLRRSCANETNVQPPLIIGDLTINPSSRDVLINERRLKLSFKEFRLLYKLAQNRGEVVPSRTLEAAIEVDCSNAHRRLSQTVKQLRDKMGDDARSPIWILSVRGVGYQFIDRD